jgi:hypothetical protein
LQNDAAPMLIDDRPFLDLLQRSKAAQAGKVIVQATIADAGRLNGAADITHADAWLKGWHLITGRSTESRHCITSGLPRAPTRYFH